jgi:hypothetical protein
MIRRPSLALLIIVSGAFFLLGLYSVFVQGGPTPSASSTSGTPSIPGTASPTHGPADQTTILILGVDSLKKNDPTLKAVWYLTYQPPATDVFLLGVPFDLPVTGSPGTSLQQAFGYSGSDGVSFDFLQGLRASIPLQFGSVVVMDDVGFSAAVDFVGGLKVDQTTFTGEDVLGILSLTADNSKDSLNTQKRVLEGLGSQASKLGQSPDLTPLVDLIPEHIYLSSPLGDLVSQVAPILPVTPEKTHIELY